MLWYNFLKYNKNYSKATGSSSNYYRDKPISGIGDMNNSINYFIKDSKSFDCKTSITGKLEGNNPEKKVKLFCQ